MIRSGWMGCDDPDLQGQICRDHPSSATHSEGLPGGFGAGARRKLVQLDNATVLKDLSVPPGNRLEALKGAGRGMHSIRISDQWRIVFRWTVAGPEEVEITDYH